jgi:prevent-host-death family protein
MRRREVGIADLKDHLSEHLRSAERGAEIVVVDRRRPIARIVPIETSTRAVAVIAPARPLAARDLRPGRPARWAVSSLDLLEEERQRR